MSSITRFMDCIYFAEGRLFRTTDETLYKLIDFGKNSKFPERYLGIILPNPTKDNIMSVRFGTEQDILSYFLGVDLNREAVCYLLDTKFKEFEEGIVKHTIMGKDLMDYYRSNFPELLIWGTNSMYETLYEFNTVSLTRTTRS